MYLQRPSNGTDFFDETHILSLPDSSFNVTSTYATFIWVVSVPSVPATSQRAFVFVDAYVVSLNAAMRPNLTSRPVEPPRVSTALIIDNERASSASPAS